jgi:serine/threonine protein kinase
MKVVRKEAVNHPILQDLMKQELEVLAQADHPNIVRVFDLLEDDKNYYIITEIIEGGELYHQIVKRGRFTKQASASVIKQLLLSLNYMHQ